MHHSAADSSGEKGLQALSAADAEIESALEEANLPTLLLVLAQLTGDDCWLRSPYVPSRARALDDNDSGGFEPAVQARIRAAALDVMRGLRDDARPVPPPPGEADLIERLSVSLGEPVPAEYGETFREEGGFVPRGGIEWSGGRPDDADRLSIAVIGAGPAGISVAQMLRRLGLDYTIFERNDDVGGVWFANDYPGAGVDTPSHMYSFSYAPRREWSRYYAKQPEILDYLRSTARDVDALPHIRFRSDVVGLTWHADASEWELVVRDPAGTHRHRARVVISCVGILSQPKVPVLDGAERFGGPVFHSSRWPRDLDVRGKRVAVIGTGATAMQIVPAIADAAARTLVFQRSPQWVAPNGNYLREVPEGTRLLMAQLPYYAAFYRLRLTWQFQDKLLASLHRDPAWPHPERSVNAVNDKHRDLVIAHIQEQLVGRPDLIEKVVPDYPPYGKRILMDNDWYRTLRRDDVELIAADVAGLAEGAVLTADGESHAADVAVLATGFHATRLLWPMEVTGRDGTELHEQWGDDNASAYLGISVPRFPNLFLVGGPHTFLGHGGSVLYSLEVGIGHIAQLLVAMVEQRLGSVEVREDVYDAYNRAVDEEHESLIWTHPGMSTWYRNRHGRIIAMTPWRGVDYWQMTHAVDLGDYILQREAIAA